MEKLTATCIIESRSILGEGPVWHAGNELLFWVDIEGKFVHAYNPVTKEKRHWQTPKRVSFVVPTQHNNMLVIGLQGQLSTLNIDSGEIKQIIPVERDMPDNRSNDGKCDATGRLWFGTMHLKSKSKAGSLYCVEPSLKVHKVLDQLNVANGMGWSADNQQMYFIDSQDQHVKSFEFNVQQVSLSEPTVVIHAGENELPDGMCVDEEGMVWIGFWGGYRVGRYNPIDGEQLAHIELPAPNVTSCCFGGANLKTLYITTAREGLTAQQLRDYPLSGGLFSCEVNVKGTLPHQFQLP